MSNFKKLIRHYAGDRVVCNCGQAYYTNCGHAVVDGVEVFDFPVCKHGCGPAQIEAKEYIADCILKQGGSIIWETPPK